MIKKLKSPVFPIIIALTLPQVTKASSDSLIVPQPKKAQFEVQRKAYFTASLGVMKLNDSYMQAFLNKSVVKNFHTDLMLGNLEKVPIHFFMGVNYAVTGGIFTADASTDGVNFVNKSKVNLFQTEVGFRGYLNRFNLAMNPLFFKMSWLHGVHDMKYDHYNNEYNGVAFGIGITRPFNNNGNAYHVSLDYQSIRQNRPSIIKNGKMDLDIIQVNLGITF